jgi:hypothetical protein
MQIQAETLGEAVTVIESRVRLPAGDSGAPVRLSAMTGKTVTEAKGKQDPNER